jgi:hypothetical protein
VQDFVQGRSGSRVRSRTTPVDDDSDTTEPEETGEAVDESKVDDDEFVQVEDQIQRCSNCERPDHKAPTCPQPLV